MTIDSVRQIANKKLIDIRGIDGFNVLRGIHTVGSTPIAIYYIDYSETPLEIDQLQSYQEKLISTDYYSNSGALQWNYYLLFIRELVDLEVKKAVEQNDIYTRKFILSQAEFQTYFDYTQSSDEIKGDIVIGWKEKLRAANLQEVWSKSSYVSAIDRYVSGNSLKDETPEELPSVETKAITNQHIERIQLNQGYRPFPSTREFQFTNVNLISGINGVGKTSLLEAIELVLCGKSMRYTQNHEAPGSISIVFKGGPIETYTPNDNSKYQARDSAWYNNLYKQRNYLDLGFNKYNYFNAESAYRLNDADLKEYKTQLESLALGSQFSYMTDRLIGFQKRLAELEKDFARKLQQHQNNIAQAKAQRSELGKLTDPASLMKQLKDLLLSVSWNSAAVNSMKKDTALLESSLSQVMTIMTELLKAGLPRSVSALNVELQRVEKLNETLLAFEKKDQELNQKSTECEKEINSLENRFQVLRGIEKYYQVPGAIELLGLDTKIKDLKNDLDFLDRVIKLSSTIKWDLISDQHAIFKNLSLSTSEKLKVAQSDKSLIEDQYKLLSINLDKLTQLETQIKSLGAEFINLNSSVDTCPLCGTEYEHQELKRRISEIRKEMSKGIDLIPVAEQLVKKENEINALLLQLQQLMVIEDAAKLIYDNSDFAIEQVMTIRNKIEESLELREQINQKFRDSTSLKERMIKSDLTEAGLAELLSSMRQSFSDFDLTKNDTSKLKTLLDEIISKRDQTKAKLEMSRAEHKKLQSSITTTIGNVLELRDAKQRSQVDIEMLRKSIQYVEQLSKHIKVPDEFDFTELDLKVKQIDDFLRRYKLINVNTEQVKVLDSIISQSTSELEKEITPTLTKVRSGLSLIEEILGGDEKNKLLKEFFDHNDEQIQDIFQRIHAPRELNKILFFTDDKNEIQIVRNNGKSCKINEISSGQRSALALSIFLTLNKKLRNGPNILLFDDPVAFIDDLNILSFLDYLREVAIHESRQIFFATANQRLAGFFEKKFGFLKSNQEFSNIVLNR